MNNISDTSDLIFKICSKCKQELNISYFYKNKHMRDGHAHMCRQCVKQYLKDHSEAKKLSDRKYIAKIKNQNKTGLISRVVENKVCPKCSNMKDISQFHRDKTRPDGHQIYCKECLLGMSYEYIKSDVGKATQKRYHVSNKGRLSSRKAASKQRVVNNDKCIARQKVRNAIMKNILPPPTVLGCFSCGDTATQYHHIDYVTKDCLNVAPVCVPCHFKIHQADRRE